MNAPDTLQQAAERRLAELRELADKLDELAILCGPSLRTDTLFDAADAIRQLAGIEE